MEDDIEIISDEIEIHPWPERGRYAVVRNGAVYGTYQDHETALELAEELASKEATR